jgi:hypothetical protein
MTAPDTPFKGLLPYTEEDADWFFGRDAEREVVGANLQSARLTLLYGVSGAGKSSVLRAAVLHGLLDEQAEERAQGRQPEFVVVYFRGWIGDVRANLLKEVEASAERAFGTKTELGAGLMFGTPAEQNRSAFSSAARRSPYRLLLILDQFEEYFLYHPRDVTFDEDLARIVNTESLNVNVLISLREDSLSRLDRFKGRIPQLFNNYLRIKHLNRESGRDATEKPVARYRELFPDRAIAFEPALVDEILDSVTIGKVEVGERGRGAIESGTSRIEAPFLQLVLVRLWQDALTRSSKKVTAADLHRLGGANVIVQTHLEQVLAKLTPPQRELAAEVFRYLITPTGSKVAHSAVDLAALTQTNEQAVRELLMAFTSGSNRILRVTEASNGDTGQRFEIFHDILGLAILEWRRRFVEAARQAGVARRRLKRAAYAAFGLLLAGALGLLGVKLLEERERGEELRLAARVAETRLNESNAASAQADAARREAERKQDELLLQLEKCSNVSRYELEKKQRELREAQAAAAEALKRAEAARLASLRAKEQMLQKGCFPAGTPVTVPGGASVAIESLRAGDRVLAVEPSGALVPVRVLRVLLENAPILSITTSLGVLRTTADHPLATSTSSFAEAGELGVGDAVLGYRGGFTSIRLLAFAADERPSPVYNLTVEPPHTFIAGGVVVHNKL